MISALCNGYGNIMFHEVRIDNPELFDPLVQAGGFQRETYFPICAHQVLPDTLDRALYLDAGDTMVVGDIAPYYFCDFEENYLIVTGAKFKNENGLQSVLSAEDAQNHSLLPWILDGLFNSGSYVVNLQKMREAELDISYYYGLTERLRSFNLQLLVGDGVYWGDQGLLSVAFIGSIKYYGFQKTQKSWYGPYNFTVAYYNQHDQKPDYEPVIYHFAGEPLSRGKSNIRSFPNDSKRQTVYYGITAN